MQSTVGVHTVINDLVTESFSFRAYYGKKTLSHIFPCIVITKLKEASKWN